jgi:hypothetical protein
LHYLVCNYGALSTVDEDAAGSIEVIEIYKGLADSIEPRRRRRASMKFIAPHRHFVTFADDKLRLESVQGRGHGQTPEPTDSNRRLEYQWL